MRLDLSRCNLARSAEGHLQVTSEHGQFVIEPWQSGFAAYRLIGASRSVVALWDTPLLHGPRRAAGADVLSQFLAGIPADVGAAASRYRFGQALMLHAAASYKPARDLLRSNPNLLWLLVFAIYERRVPLEHIPESCRMKQPVLLDKAIGTGSVSLVRLLKRIEIRDGLWEDARVLQHALFNESVVDAVLHLGRMPFRLMESLYRYPALRSGAMARLLAEELLSNPSFSLRSVDAIARKISDIVTFAERSGVHNAEQIVACCRSIGDVRRLHRRWERRMHEAAARCDFPPPPLPGSDDIEALVSREALRAEGMEQRNCVGEYARRVASGQVYFYRVLRPSRGTVALHYTDGRWQLGQFKLYANLAPDADARQAVERWYDERMTVATGR